MKGDQEFVGSFPLAHLHQRRGNVRDWPRLAEAFVFGLSSRYGLVDINFDPKRARSGMPIETDTPAPLPFAPLHLSGLKESVRSWYPKSSADPILADVLRVLRELVMAERGVCELEARRVIEHEDLRGLLARAIPFSRIQGNKAKRTSSARRVPVVNSLRTSRVVSVAKLVIPECIGIRRHRDVRSVVPPAWRPLLDTV